MFSLVPLPWGQELVKATRSKINVKPLAQEGVSINFLWI